MDSYLTVLSDGMDEHIEKKSRFIGYCAPVQTEEQAIEFINSIKKKHSDARHNCYAYRLRDGQIQRYSDDGEPQGTAGIPILEVLSKQNIVDCAVVVTRYFGGVLLGTGGLVRAYTKGAKIAVDSAKIVEMCPCDLCDVSCDYATYSTMQNILTDFDAVVDDTTFADIITITFHIPCEITDDLQKEITEKSFGKIKILKKEIKFLPIKRDFSEICE